MKYAWMGVAAISAALPAAAAAQSDQSVPPGVGVADRLRPEYDPIGGRIGGMFLFPRVDAAIAATDNVLAAANDRKSDVVAELRPSVALRSDWSLHRLVAEAYASQNVHARLSREDVTQYGASIDGTYDAARTTALRVTAEAQHLVLDRTAYNNVISARSPVEYDRYTGSLGASHDFNRLSVGATVSVLRADFSDATSYDGVPIDQDFRDFVQIAAAGSARYRFGAGPSLIARVLIDRNDYDQVVVGQERNSDGIKLEGGFGFDVSKILYGEIRAGYIRRNYKNLLFPDASGLSFGANLLWNVTPLTSVRFRADRSFEESRSGAAAANLISQGEVGVDHELLRYVILTGSARYAHIDPVGDQPASQEYAGALRARYLVDRRIQLNAGYQFIKRTGATLNQPFTANVLTLGLRYTL